MSNLVEKLWFGKHPLAYILLPFSFMYWGITALRRLCYKLHVFKVYQSKVPVIVIGNIMIGGNGKTPVVIALAAYFKERGLRVAVVSRGYGAQPPHYPYEVTKNSSVKESGDEPKLIALRTGVRVIIDPIRVRAIKFVENDVDVILTDDGLQHYAMGRDIEVIVTDGVRRLGNGLLLPAGPLREGAWRLKKVDFHIVNGGQATEKEYAMKLVPGSPYPLDGTSSLSKNAKVACLAGIGDPNRFYRTVSDMGFVLEEKLSVADHGRLNVSELQAAGAKRPLLMTEKDMVKYQAIKLTNCFAIGVDAELPTCFYEKMGAKFVEIRDKK